ncbi:MAG TPA: response regulator transcription factor [Rhodocyclaceae bacterium]|nr:response regulator transcription factor [Rhodocyclaceae bacterium]HRQ48707.1 response regulator transcription factor [Rhodocyclaceae bacterium]
MTIRVLIADDHAIVRHGLCRLIALTSDIVLAGEARDGWEVVEKVRAGGFDLLLTDMSMPGPNGPELVKRVRVENAALPILVLSMHGESQIAARAIKAGATGYLTKDSDPEMLLDAIRRCAAGRHFIEPDLASRLVFESDRASTPDLHARLSDREFQIFTLLAQGFGVNEIAERMHISPKTVSTHKFRLMQKMAFESLSELVRYALRHGLIES